MHKSVQSALISSSGGAALYVGKDVVCPWEEVGPGFSYAAILDHLHVENDIRVKDLIHTLSSASLLTLSYVLFLPNYSPLLIRKIFNAADKVSRKLLASSPFLTPLGSSPLPLTNHLYCINTAFIPYKKRLLFTLKLCSFWQTQYWWQSY